jgi:hypothetical protein
MSLEEEVERHPILYRLSVEPYGKKNRMFKGLFMLKIYMNVFAPVPNAKRFRIYCIYHKFLTEEAYKDLSSNYIEKYIRFVGVNQQIEKTIPEKLKKFTFQERNLAYYDPFLQFNRFCETSVFFHVQRNPTLLLQPFEYVGFIQYDMVLQDSLFELIEETLEKENYQSNILFYHYSDIGTNHLLSAHGYTHKDPLTDKTFVRWETMNQEKWAIILGIYNELFKTNHVFNKVAILDIPLYHTYLMHKHIFQKMMHFAMLAIPRIFEMLNFNTRHLPYHIERCHGLFLLCQKIEGHLPIWIHLPGIEHRESLKDNWQKKE